MIKKFGKEEWIELFQKMNITPQQMKDWHHLFESQYPQAHQSFLEWLGLEPSAIKNIRQNS